jgi:hypothetical protein
LLTLLIALLAVAALTLILIALIHWKKQPMTNTGLGPFDHSFIHELESNESLSFSDRQSDQWLRNCLDDNHDKRDTDTSTVDEFLYLGDKRDTHTNTDDKCVNDKDHYVNSR